MSNSMVVSGRSVFPTFKDPQVHPSDTSPNPKTYFSQQILIPKGDPQIAAIEALELKAIADKFTNGDVVKAAPIYAAAKAIGKVALRDGDLKEHDSYHGNMYLSMRTESTRGKPKVFGPAGKAAGEVDPLMVFGGCHVRTKVNFFGYGGIKAIPKGCAAGLGDTQFVRDGDAFGAGAPRATDDEFGAIDNPDNDPLMG